MVAVGLGHSQNYKGRNLLTIEGDNNGEVCYLGGKRVITADYGSRKITSVSR
jgi:hypothetical protein